MKVFLACTSDKPFIPAVKDIDYALESFYYIQDWQIPLIHKWKMFMLDSGAFTFMCNAKKHIDWQEYLDQYIKFIVDNDVRYFFELDIDDVVGYEKVLELRARLERETMRPSIPVWHINRGKTEFVKMCQDYEYVAIGGMVGNDKHSPANKAMESYLPWYIQTAHKYGAKIHGLGFTSMQKLKRCHFDSVDSTNWKSGGRFGQIHTFTGDRIVSQSYRNKRVKDYKAIDAHNLVEWIKFSRWAENHL